MENPQAGEVVFCRQSQTLSLYIIITNFYAKWYYENVIAVLYILIYRISNAIQKHKRRSDFSSPLKNLLSKELNFPFFQSIHDHTRQKSYCRSCDNSADKQNGKIERHLGCLRPQARCYDLSDVMENTADDAHGDSGKPVCLFE
jgi:hypothetical protein